MRSLTNFVLIAFLAACTGTIAIVTLQLAAQSMSYRSVIADLRSAVALPTTQDSGLLDERLYIEQQGNASPINRDDLVIAVFVPSSSALIDTLISDFSRLRTGRLSLRIYVLGQASARPSVPDGVSISSVTDPLAFSYATGVTSVPMTAVVSAGRVVTAAFGLPTSSILAETAARLAAGDLTFHTVAAAPAPIPQQSVSRLATDRE